MQIDYSHLVDRLRQGHLVAFLGAGASLSYNDPHTGRNWLGVPGAGELVRALSTKRAYVKADMPFPEATFLLRHREGRSAVENFVLEAIDRPAVKPLPAHVILANLPFAAFLTTNYDSLLEQALREARKRPHAIVSDSDVPRLRPTNTPVIKLHGCVSRPASIVAAEDEYRPWAERSPIIDALLKATLANKTILFLGFGLDDWDFREAYHQVKLSLGEWAPRSVAVVREPREFSKTYWEARGVNVLDVDLTDFLRGLLRATADVAPPAVYQPSEDWLDNAYFESLHKIRTLPSETQVVDAFLTHFVHELGNAGFTLDDVIDRAAKAVSVVLARRPNFEGLRKMASVIERIRTECATKDAAEGVLRDLITDRLTIGRGIAAKARDIVKKGDAILVFSQSIRVLELLKGAPRGVQDSCRLYVAECRPKSPAPFQDALSIAENLSGTGYELVLVPDAAVGNLLRRHQVEKVVLGAHAVFMRGATPASFVNTCGSQLIVEAAKRDGVPVYVVAEQGKIVHLPDDAVQPVVSFQEEEELFSSIGNVVSDLKASGQKIGCLNIGYDLCEFDGVVHLVSDR